MPARKPKIGEKSQSEWFIETAREIGADENPETFERIFKEIVKVKTPPAPATDSGRSETT